MENSSWGILQDAEAQRADAGSGYRLWCALPVSCLLWRDESPLRATENEIGTIVLETAIAIHRELGPSLLETVYETILAHELQERGLKILRQVPIPIDYHGMRFEEGFRADIQVENKVILELKSVEKVRTAHKTALWRGRSRLLRDFIPGQNIRFATKTLCLCASAR